MQDLSDFLAIFRHFVNGDKMVIYLFFYFFTDTNPSL